MTSAHVLKVISTLKLWGWVGFWVQVVLSVVSGIILLVFVGTRSLSTPEGAGNPATLPGLGFAWFGLAMVAVSVFWYWRYTQWAEKLRREDRPSKQETLQQIKIGVVISLVGMLLTLLGAGAIVGSLTAKSLQQQPVLNTPNTLAVQPIDFFVVQANINTILAHFLGLVISLWLLQRISDRSPQ